MYPTIEDVEKVLQDGIKRNDFFSYILSAVDRKIVDDGKAPAYVALNTEKVGWVLCVDPRRFEKVLKESGQESDRDGVLFAILLHEFFHIARDHFSRGEVLRQSFSMMELNVAADMAVNCTLPDRARKSIERTGGVFPAQYGFPEDLQMEKYLEHMAEEKRKNGFPQKAKGSPGNGGEDRKKSPKNMEEWASEVLNNPDVAVTIREMEEALEKEKQSQASKGSGADSEDACEIDPNAMPGLATTRLKGEIQKRIQDLEKIGIDIREQLGGNGRGFGSGGWDWLLEWIFPKLNLSWKKMFKNTMMGNVRSREWYRSFRRVHPRSDSGVILKGKYPLKKEKVLVLLDTSGSMSSQDYEQFFGVVQSLKQDEMPVFVAQWDYGQIKQEPIPLETYRKGNQASFRGGGGTDMVEGVNYIHEHYPEFKRVVVVTDGGTPYFTAENPSPVPLVWVITNTDSWVDDADGTVICLGQR